MMGAGRAQEWIGPGRGQETRGDRWESKMIILTEIHHWPRIDEWKGMKSNERNAAMNFEQEDRASSRSGIRSKRFHTLQCIIQDMRGSHRIRVIASRRKYPVFGRWWTRRLHIVCIRVCRRICWLLFLILLDLCAVIRGRYRRFVLLDRTLSDGMFTGSVGHVSFPRWWLRLHAVTSAPRPRKEWRTHQLRILAF